jgi:hypothetical protein
MTTPEWKSTVMRRLGEQKRSGREPSTLKALARAIGADPGGINKLMKGDQQTSKYAEKICEVLGVEPATLPNPAIGADEWDRIVDYMRSLPRERQEHALRVLRTFLDAK